MTDINALKIIRSRRRSIGLEVCRDATLVVRAPLHTSIEYINKLIEKKKGLDYQASEFLRTAEAIDETKGIR